jgi:DNA-nicking Smr family endonuclease
MFEEYVGQSSVQDKDTKPAGRVKPKRDPSSIDLHGLNRDQAIARVENAIRSMKRGARETIRAITGEGNRSETSYAVLKTAVGDYLSDNCGRFGVGYRSTPGGWIIWLEK